MKKTIRDDILEYLYKHRHDEYFDAIGIEDDPEEFQEEYEFEEEMFDYMMGKLDD